MPLVYLLQGDPKLRQPAYEIYIFRAYRRRETHNVPSSAKQEPSGSIPLGTTLSFEGFLFAKYSPSVAPREGISNSANPFNFTLHFGGNWHVLHMTTRLLRVEKEPPPWRGVLHGGSLCGQETKTTYRRFKNDQPTRRGERL